MFWMSLLKILFIFDSIESRNMKSLHLLLSDNWETLPVTRDMSKSKCDACTSFIVAINITAKTVAKTINTKQANRCYNRNNTINTHKLKTNKLGKG